MIGGGNLTVSSKNYKITYLGNDTNRSFGIPFIFSSVSDIRVTLDKVALGVNDFTVVEAEDDSYAVIYPADPEKAALASGSELMIYRVTDLMQETALSNQKNLNLKTLEKMADKQMLIAQELDGRVANIETETETLEAAVTAGENAAVAAANSANIVETIAANVATTFVELEERIEAIDPKNTTSVGGSTQAGKYVQTNVEGYLDRSLQQRYYIPSTYTLYQRQWVKLSDLVLSVVDKGHSYVATLHVVNGDENPYSDFSEYQGSAYGVLRVCIKLSDSGGIKDATLTWLYVSNNLEARYTNFKLVHSIEDDGTIKCALWCNPTNMFEGYYFTVGDEGGSGNHKMTFYSNGSYQTEPPTGEIISASRGIRDTFEMYLNGYTNFKDLTSSSETVGYFFARLYPGEKIIIKDYRSRQSDGCKSRIFMPQSESYVTLNDEGEYLNINQVLYYYTGDSVIDVDVLLELYKEVESASFSDDCFIWIRFAIIT